MATVEGATEVRLLGGFSIRRGGEEVPPSVFRAGWFERSSGC